MSEFAYVIDDDEAVRLSLRTLLGARDNRLVMTFASAEAFLADIDQREGGVVLLDLHMPGISGLDLLARLAPMRDRFATIIVTGQGDVPLAVQAMRGGAIDFLEKPYDHHALFSAVDRGFALLEQSAGMAERVLAARRRVDALSRRELEVLRHLVAGASNRAMAEAMGLSVRTVEVHRANVMAKLEVSSLSRAIALAQIAGIADPTAQLDIAATVA